MKNFLTLIFLIPLLASAQDSCKLKKSTDPFTHQTKISTGFVNFATPGAQVNISIDATSTDIDFFVWVKNDGKCFDDQSTALVNYEGDRLKATFKNTGSMNCEGAFHFTFRNTTATPGALERLSSKKIASIKLTNAKIITEISFNDEQRQQLMRMIGCLVRESKSLIKQ
jgi:hypothetical protein